MTTLEIIIAELERQHEASRAGGLGYLRLEDPKRAVIDGEVDLGALAASIDKPAAIHNRTAGEIVKQIVRPTLEAGGQMTDVLVLLESVVLGVILVAVKLGGDEIVLDQVVAGAKARLAEQRLGPIETKGQA